MPERNRVTPYGTIDAIAQRGAFTGNRGILHEGRDIVRTHANIAWLTCALQYRDRHEQQWVPHRLTWLFFIDEAVALAAGHRPCARCRRSSYEQYRQAWARATGAAAPHAADIDRRLDRERRVPRTSRQLTQRAGWADLPDGTFVDSDGTPWLVLGPELVRWTPTGYADRAARPRTGEVTVLTTPAGVAVLAAGYPLDLSRAGAAVRPTAAGTRDN